MIIDENQEMLVYLVVGRSSYDICDNRCIFHNFSPKIITFSLGWLNIYLNLKAVQQTSKI